MKMKLQPKTLEKLRKLINEETEYRTGSNLVRFFNSLGFKDVYEQGFPSRWAYTENKLDIINGTTKLEECIKALFSPVNYIGRVNELDLFVTDFNQYLLFDGWEITIKGKDVTFKKLLETNSPNEDENTEDKFLSRDFREIDLSKLKFDESITAVLQQRLDEIKKCLKSNASLSTIFLCGSTLEGILLGLASNNARYFNTAKSSPKDKNNTPLKFDEWTLSDFINVSKELGFIQEDVKKFSLILREFRNYIHPHQQNIEKFNPTEHTAKLCWQTLKAALSQVLLKSEELDKLRH